MDESEDKYTYQEDKYTYQGFSGGRYAIRNEHGMVIAWTAFESYAKKITNLLNVQHEIGKFLKDGK